MFTHGTVVKTILIIDRRSLFTCMFFQLKENTHDNRVTMKTDWNETFRFDEEETELAHNTIETYDSVKREFTNAFIGMRLRLSRERG